jgi:[ribosomal protein S5]-alanine N-acetyltransferase
VAPPWHTERLVLREFVAADADELFELFSDPRVVWWQAPFSREETRQWLERALARYRDDGMAEYAVVLASSGEVIGDCGPVFRDVGGESLPELGWDLRYERWGFG